MFRLSGIMGIPDPSPYSLRQLNWLVQAKQETQWDHTASIIAMIHNTNCTRTSHLKAPIYFNPYRKQVREKPDMQLDAKASISVLKRMLIPR